MQSHDSAVIISLKEIVTAYQAHLKEGEKKVKKQTPRYFTAQEYFDDEFKHFSDTSTIISFFDQHSAATKGNSSTTLPLSVMTFPPRIPSTEHKDPWMKDNVARHNK